MIFSWNESKPNLSYEVITVRNGKFDPDWSHINHTTNYTVSDVLRYDALVIDVRVTGKTDWGRKKYKGMI